VPIDRPETGRVILYNFLWAREHDRGVEHGRKARPACVVVPLTGLTNDVVLFPLTTRAPEPGRLAVQVPETERRRLRLRGSGPSWIVLDEGNRDVLPGSFHVEPISHDPAVYDYGAFSQAFMRVVLRTLAEPLRARSVRVVTRER
jgi:hypothetical protein